MDYAVVAKDNLHVYNSTIVSGILYVDTDPTACKYSPTIISIYDSHSERFFKFLQGPSTHVYKEVHFPKSTVDLKCKSS